MGGGDRILKARPVAGNIALGGKLLGELGEILRRRFSSTHGGDSRELARQLIHTRAKLKQERHEGASGFKSCVGGFFDIDYIGCVLDLARGLVAGENDSVPHPMNASGRDLSYTSCTGSWPANIVAQIAFLESRGALDGEQASVLRDAAMFYRSLDHAIRLVLGRPLAELPEPMQIPRVSALLDRWNVPIPRVAEKKKLKRREVSSMNLQDASSI